MDAVHYRFGHFLLQPERRCLSAAGVPVSVSARALDLLTLLIERHDRVVTKDEILAAVWAGSIVEENNLAVQVSALRRLLGPAPDGGQYIMTVPGRGYRFVATLEDDVAPVDSATPAVAPAAATRRRWSAGGLAGGLAALLLVLAGLGWRLLPASPLSAPRLSIVVLPFRNLGGDPQQDYLADAISDDVSTDLSHLPGSVVISRESAETFKGRPVRAEAIGRALNVRYLLHGSLMREGAGLHVNVQLIDAADGRQLWASGFDVAQDALGTARDEIVRHLAVALDFTLVQIEAARSLHERPGNADAVDDYLRARSLLDRGDSLATFAAGQELLQKAVALAPGFADAQALLAIVLVDKMAEFDDPDDWSDHERAGKAVTAALAASPQNPQAIAARGMFAWVDNHCDLAEPDFHLALSLDHAAMSATLGLVACLRESGHMRDMILGLQEVLRVDPASSQTPYRESMIGLGLLMLGKPHEALGWLRRGPAFQHEPSGAPETFGAREWNQLYLIAATELDGQQTEAAALYAAYQKRWPNRTVWRLASYDARAWSAMPAHAAYLEALHTAGMPLYADETADVPSTISTGASHGDFDPTPLSLPHAGRVDTGPLWSMLTSGRPLLILDVGRGAAVIPGAILAWPQDVAGDRNLILFDAARQRRSPSVPIVVMGDSLVGWSSYDAAVSLVEQGFAPVLWYRGGEEAWVAAGHPHVDNRPD